MNPIGILTLLQPQAVSALQARRPPMPGVKTSGKQPALEPDTYQPSTARQALPQVTYNRQA